MAISKIVSNSIAPSQTLTTPVISGLMDLQGGQIKFPVAQVASADGNTLDDYEEGTWTPTSGTSGLTVASFEYAAYTKIGRLVTAYCYIGSLNNTSGSTITSFQLNGLPFTSQNYGPCFQYYGSTNSTANLYVQANQPYALISRNVTPGAGTSAMFAFVYFTN